MGRTFVETIMGLVVVLVAMIFLIFAWKQADLGAIEGYRLKANFPSIGGLPNGSDVRVNGIKIGSVLSQHIDPVTFEAIVEMSISPQIHLPSDTIASIDSDGLMGGKFVKIEPGHQSDRIDQNGIITHTKGTQSLEELVGKIIFLAADSGTPKDSSK
jgi:phospholipid/cholesterol/gamma-HCH transport system substrate-binding protein